MSKRNKNRKAQRGYSYNKGPINSAKYIHTTCMSRIETTLSGDSKAVLPRVLYTNLAAQKITHLVNKVHQEVGWFGLVDELDSGDYLITDIFVPKQKVGPATCNITTETVEELALELLEQGVDIGKMQYWGHSHVSMAVHPSGQDEWQVEQFIDGASLFIRGIHNKRGETKMDVYLPKEDTVYQCVDTGLEDGGKIRMTTEVMDEIEAAIRENVEYTVFQYRKPSKPYKPFGYVNNPNNPVPDRRVHSQAEHNPLEYDGPDFDDPDFDWQAYEEWFYSRQGHASNFNDY